MVLPPIALAFIHTVIVCRKDTSTHRLDRSSSSRPKPTRTTIRTFCTALHAMPSNRSGMRPPHRTQRPTTARAMASMTLPTVTRTMLPVASTMWRRRRRRRRQTVRVVAGGAFCRRHVSHQPQPSSITSSSSSIRTNIASRNRTAISVAAAPSIHRSTITISTIRPTKRPTPQPPVQATTTSSSINIRRRRYCRSRRSNNSSSRTARTR